MTTMRRVASGLAVVALAGGAWLAWQGRGPEGVAGLKSLQASGARAQAGSAGPSGPPLKCVGADGRVSYTQGECPSGQRAQAVSGGTVNVVAAPALPASAGASAQPALRRLAGSEQEIADMRRKAQEKAAGL